MNINSTSVNVKLWDIPFERKKQQQQQRKGQEKKRTRVLVSVDMGMRALDAKIRRREWEKPIKIKIFMYSRGGS